MIGQRLLQGAKVLNLFIFGSDSFSYLPSKLSSCIFDGRVGGGQSGATTMLALRFWPVRCGGGRNEELEGGHRFWALNF